MGVLSSDKCLQFCLHFLKRDRCNFILLIYLLLFLVHLYSFHCESDCLYIKWSLPTVSGRCCESHKSSNRTKLNYNIIYQIIFTASRCLLSWAYAVIPTEKERETERKLCWWSSKVL